MKELSKKGQGMGGLQSLIMGIVGAAIVLVVGIIVVAELKGSTTEGNATAAAGTILTKMGTIPTWIGVIIVVSLAMITLSYFYNK